MKVRDVMTEAVVTVTPDTPLKQAARRMLEHGVSGLPVVVDGDRVVGVLSETDILCKERSAPERQGLVEWVLHYGDDPPAAKLTARTAGEAMTSPAITISPRRNVADAAALMLDLRVDRLPVIDGEQLVGIVTRADLVRAFARDDGQIEDELTRNVLVTASLPPDAITIGVDDGKVTLGGRVEAETVAQLIESQARTIPGVVAVESHFTYPTDGEVAR
jgi:CBS domain-containing protein